jgi:hypothetical protein
MSGETVLVHWRRLSEVSSPAGGHMTKAKTRDQIYRRRRVEREIIELCVRCYSSRSAESSWRIGFERGNSRLVPAVNGGIGR